MTTSYASLIDFKSYARITTTDAGDDGVIEDCLRAATAWLEASTGRRFVAVTATKTFDVPSTTGNVLWIKNDDLLSVTSITNGNGAALTASDYILHPANEMPKYAIEIKPSTGKAWEADGSGNTAQVIGITGAWGFSTTPPDDIREACLQITHALYKRRFGENVSAETAIMPSGVVVQPQDIPSLAWRLATYYRRWVYG